MEEVPRPSQPAPAPPQVEPPVDDAEEPEAPSRAPHLPPAPNANRTLRIAKARGGKGGTVRMMAPGASDDGRTSIGRSTSTSSDGARRSRLSVLRESLLSALPPIPKSLAALGGPATLIALIMVLAVLAFAFMIATGRLPDGLKSRLPFREAEQDDKVPPPPSNVSIEEVDEIVPPSARPGRASVGRAVLQIPKTFTAADDGAFDLVVHFNGNTELVLESYEVALLDTVVLVVNLGNGSGVYDEAYTNPDALARVFDKVPKIVAARGLEGAHLRRVALSGWSAGYGSIVRILGQREHAERIDAVILLDGLHTSKRPGTDIVDGTNIEPVVRFAERAKRGEKLLVITHSNIEPVGGYLGVKPTVDHLLAQVGSERSQVSATTTIPRLKAAKGVLPEDELRPLELRTEVRAGGLIVRGFGGDQAAHHISHLMQMSVVALPELAKRWAR